MGQDETSESTISPASVVQGLEVGRRELLDLTTRSRLLHTPRGTRVKIVQVTGRSAEEVFRILVSEGKSVNFLPRPEPDGEVAAEPDGESDALGQLLAPEVTSQDDPAARRASLRLPTAMPASALEKRLLQIYYDARSFQEEQGVNVLYLALGFLKWFEADASDRPRFAPLILIPVTIDRGRAGSRFRIQLAEDELSTNLSLQEKLKLDFGIHLPDLPAADDLSPAAYYDEVAGQIADRPRWEVLRDDVVLGFFSFAKFLMYRDLDPSTWPEGSGIENHALIRGLLGEGFRQESSPFAEDADVDDILDPRDAVHVTDADSSQTLAIEEVRKGRDLVIQGPPGTGKSQTITNLIAVAVREGKRVLFVAEKMAALEVVKRRLDEIGLGDMCLELHSHKARKKLVLEELQRTLELGRPNLDGAGTIIDRLRTRRDQLNNHVRALHSPLNPESGFTPYQIAGHLVALRSRGIQPQEYTLERARDWTRDVLRTKEERIERLAGHVAEMGTPAEHPWRGVRVRAMLPQDVARLEAPIVALCDPLASLHSEASTLATDLGTASDTWRDVAGVLRLARAVARAPELDRGALENDVWEHRRAEISEAVECGRILASARNTLKGVLVEEAWENDLRPVRRAFRAYGGSWLRVFRGEYRHAVAMLRAFTEGDLPKALDQRVAVLDVLVRGQKARARLGELEELGRSAFGSFWKGEDSDWTALAEIDDWERETAAESLPVSAREARARLETVAEIGATADRISAAVPGVREQLDAIFRHLALDLQEAFGCETSDEIPLPALIDRLRAWAENTDRLQQWITFHVWAEDASEAGLGAVVERLYDGRIEPVIAVDSFQHAYFEELMREVVEHHPFLATFSGTAHEKLIDEFRELDRERMRIARQEVAAQHHAGIPTGNGEVGELGILRRQIRMKRRHMPLRRLMKDAGRAVQAIKPVFMMSPLSIAQYLEAGSLEFDLLLIDEASQVPPVEALGAVARTRQLVVVGDERQLPPTRFFQKLLDDGDDESAQEAEFQASDLESILGLCSAQGVSDRMLRWHYRSRHESLIAVSNREFYGNKLYIVPSALRNGDLGLQFHRVTGAVYERGASATNPEEARVVARAVLEHARKHPNLTLGVGTFSVRQRDAILDELELLRRKHPETEGFFASGRIEPFFVKNLESIQGDERDVIFISVAYGRDESGYMSMNFGPLSNEGGERRLNVLITRARQRCEVYSSMTAADIDLARTSAAGVVAFKTFLQYAETGVLGVAQPTGKAPDSPFEETVAEELRRLGFEVEHQIGVAGFFVDLAVRDPEQPGSYVLGIECDGASYHSSRSARDRDRLRQQVLEDRGWIIHRIWSTDWFHRPADELRKAFAAIERAKSQGTARRSASAAVALPADTGAGHGEIERQPVLESEPDSPESTGDVYKEAAFSAGSHVAPHEADVGELANIVTRIVEIEGPIHGDEVARRLAAVWGLQRAGTRIQSAASRGVARAVRRGMILRDGNFLTKEDREEVRPRNRDTVSSITLRNAEMIPPIEIRTGLRMVVEDHVGVAVDEAVVQVTRMFGFQRTGGGIREVIEKELRRCLGEGKLRLKDGRLYAEAS